VCYSVSQCIAVCRISELQCVAVRREVDKKRDYRKLFAEYMDKRLCAAGRCRVLYYNVAVC